MFANCENIIKIDFISFNTKFVKSMKYMFHKCKNLKYINNLFIFETRNVIDMSFMFSFCYNLNNLDLSSFNLNKVKNMSYMFYCCYNLQNLQLFSLNTQNNIEIAHIFDLCNELNIDSYNNKNINKYLNEYDVLIDVWEEDINKKIYFLDNFDGYENNIKHSHIGLKELNEENTELYINNIKNEYKKYLIPKKEGEYKIKLKFNTNLTDCSYMFADCNNILQINFICFNTKYVTTMYRMFSDCYNLNNLDLSSFNTKNVTNMSQMFSDCNNLNNLDLSSFDTKTVTNMSHMFYGCNNLNNLDLSSFDTKNVTDLKSIFYGCPNEIYESNKLKFKRFKKKRIN